MHVDFLTNARTALKDFNNVLALLKDVSAFCF